MVLFTRAVAFESVPPLANFFYALGCFWKDAVHQHPRLSIPAQITGAFIDPNGRHTRLTQASVEEQIDHQRRAREAFATQAPGQPIFLRDAVPNHDQDAPLHTIPAVFSGNVAREAYFVTGEFELSKLEQRASEASVRRGQMLSDRHQASLLVDFATLSCGTPMPFERLNQLANLGAGTHPYSAHTWELIAIR
jgi:hypothetical protein